MFVNIRVKTNFVCQINILTYIILSLCDVTSIAEGFYSREWTNLGLVFVFEEGRLSR